ncbi:MAG: CHAT domain-containing protein [Holophagales bacterium]|nr:CHAT domain-containing protein [Holophagales bacterium]
MPAETAARPGRVAYLLVVLLVACWRVAAAEPQGAADRARAEELAWRGIDQCRAGDFDRGLADLRAALAIAEHNGDRQFVASILVWIGSFQTDQQDLDAAVRTYRRALEQLEPRDHMGRWWIDFSISLSMHLSGDLEQSRSHLEGMIERLHQLEGSEALLYDFWLQTILEFGGTRDRQAAEDRRRASSPRERVRDIAESSTRMLLGTNLLAAERYEEAARQLTSAAEASARAGDAYSARIHESLAAAWIGHRDFAAAVEVMEEVLAQAPATAPGQQVRQLLLISRLERRSGQLESAGNHLAEALDLTREAEDGLTRAEVNEGLGLYYSALGRLETAAGYLEKAFSAYREAESPRASLCHTRLEAVYASLGLSGNADDSAPLVEDAVDGLLSELRSLVAGGRVPEPEELERLRELAKVARASGLPSFAFEGLDLLEALRSAQGGRGEAGVDGDPIDRLLTQLRRSPDFQLQLSGRLGIAERALRANRWQAAREEAERVLADLRGRGHPEEKTWALHLLSLALWAGGERENALGAARSAVRSLESLMVDLSVEEVAISFRDRRLGPIVYEDAVRTHALVGHWATAFHIAERARAQTLLRLSADGSFLPVAQAELGPWGWGLLAEIRELEIGAREAQGEERGRLLEELYQTRREYERYSIRTKVREVQPGERPSPIALNLPETRALLDRDTTLVSYFVTEGGLIRWVADADRSEFQTLALDAETLREWVGCWLRSLAGYRGGLPLRVPTRGGRGVELLSLEPCGRGEAVSGALYSALLAGIEPRDSRRRLLVAPHGVLHSLPFAALRDPVGGRYLVEDVTVVQLPSASALSIYDPGREEGSPPPARPESRDGVLVVGDPATYLDSLPGAEREALAVARLLGAEPLLGSRAQEDAVRERLGESRIVHFATHGVFDPRNPRWSRLVLADGARHDGHLEVHEILGLRELAGVEMVVLSGCQTALGEITAGDDVIGLGRAFLHAGVRSVVSTLWSIADEASAELMVDFYRHLEQGTAPADALRAAQLARLRDPATSDPYYWAAFTVWGDPG